MVLKLATNIPVAKTSSPYCSNEPNMLRLLRKLYYYKYNYYDGVFLSVKNGLNVNNSASTSTTLSPKKTT